jgi:hypothetical protein
MDVAHAVQPGHRHLRHRRATGLGDLLHGVDDRPVAVVEERPAEHVAHAYRRRQPLPLKAEAVKTTHPVGSTRQPARRFSNQCST